MKTDQRSIAKPIKKRFPVVLSLLVGSTLLASLSGCDKADYLSIKAAERPPLSANISFVNARAVNTALQFWAFTTQVTTTPVALNKASAYLPTVFGSVQLNFTEGTSTSYKASLQFGNSATFTATGRPNGPIATYYHSVFAAKTASAMSDTLILFYDDLKAPDSGKAKVRFVNLSPGVGPLTLSGVGGASLFSNVAYGRAANSTLSGETLNAFSLGPFVSVDPGALTLNVTRANGTPIVSAKPLALQAGKIYTLYTSGLSTSSSGADLQLIEHPVIP
jgi:hypothetical protein